MIERRFLLAHRFAWALYHRRDPGRRMVLHTCDNPGCVNPEHLRLGTAQTNAADCAKRGRAVGSGRGRKILTPDAVRAIRAMATAGRSRPEIAREIGTSPRNIWYVLSGKSWADVP